MEYKVRFRTVSVRRKAASKEPHSGHGVNPADIDMIPVFFVASSEP